MTDETPAPLTAEEEASLRAFVAWPGPIWSDVKSTVLLAYLGQALATLDATRARSVPDDRLREAKGPVVGWRWADALSALHRHGIAYETLPEGIRSALAAAAALSASPTETP